MVKYIPVILEARLIAFDISGADHVGNDSTPLFLGRETFYDDVAIVRHQPLLDFFTVPKGVRFLVPLRILQLTGGEVMGV
jgi:hypothetical protein